jgi:hypothetical protein
MAAAQAQIQPVQQPQVPDQPQQVPVQQQPSPEVAALRTEMELMRAQNQALTQQVATMQQPAQQQLGQQQAPGQQPEALPTPQFNVPDSYMNALASEDVNQRRAALNAMLNGVAEAAMNQVRQEMQMNHQQTIQQIQPMIDQQLGHFRIQQDMYGTYPELNSYRSYVEAAARQLEPQYATTGWGPDYRDAIAERVAPLVPGMFERIQANRAQRGVIVPQMQVPQAPLPQTPPQALPPGVTPAGIAGATHGQPVPQGQQPVLARDAQGNYYPVAQPPQPFLGSPQTRPDGSQVDPQVMDIWQTLGYAR